MKSEVSRRRRFFLEGKNNKFVLIVLISIFSLSSFVRSTSPVLVLVLA